MKKWYALYVNVRHEKKVMETLMQSGTEAYVPLIKTMRQWSDRKKNVEIPLFTGYVFVNISETDIDKPRYVPGVVNYLYFNHKPAIVRNEEIEALKFFIENGYYLEEAENELMPGDKAVLYLGDFRNFVAEVDEVINEEYVYVSFEGMKKNIRIRAPRAALKPMKR